jgi:hypothetical protein
MHRHVMNGQMFCVGKQRSMRWKKVKGQGRAEREEEAHTPCTQVASSPWVAAL